ncbi:E3 ubiquitin-protein ligase RNF183 [Syngnathoides biaculeatus]|uniref:E3 ubiquitin-protein ligase RNF183 n=1 Tax=Syngnathoides biaculeatus TaxID=300417 RepID=UPI002ADE91BB|nr:E3 ubiquitin-protein ligase RNF183 [Syngnathoides biaculeatus]XP_061677163.1 E3 ubiquitin-protein ligase RNF183 [Syngnathoides biaculeatus]XP_061677165.1 E3 ubiquitin-protein ligase RNF183 [Syngnathoides biaculeatus]
MSDDRERRRARRSQSHDSRPPPNVKPRMDNRRPQKVRRSRSTDSERGRRTERHSGEPNQHQHQHQHQRGRSVDTGERHRRSKLPVENDDEEPECAICFCSYDNIFKTPKLLACGHTFCLECLARINVSAPKLKTLSCPVCRELTDIPHGQDLPRLGNNQDIISRLPPEMRRARSIRFKRSKGKLLLKNSTPSSPVKIGVLNLPHKSHEAQTAPADALRLSAMESGVEPATMVDVGRPPNRVRGRIRRFFRSDRCYYITVAVVITITVALLLVGILAFVIIPNVTTSPRPPPGNQTAPPPPRSGDAFPSGL